MTPHTPRRRPRADRSGAGRGRWTAAALALSLALAGCSGQLPTDPVPERGLPVDVQPRQDVQRLLPRPQPDASPSEIVRGFLSANVGFNADDDIPRDYLTPELASAWVPTSNVLVLEGTPEVTAPEPGVVRVTAQVRGRIDESGRLVEQPTGTQTTQTFQVVPVRGEWRISTFPDGFGLWLSPQDLDTTFRPYRVYYLNPTLDYYVPDVRWLARGEGLYTSLTRAQLAPVPPYLEGAVVSGASPDIHLAVGAVPVDPTTQIATVNLVGSGLSEATERVEELRAQLAHALLALIGVTGLDLRVAGRSVGDPDGDPVTTSADLGYRDAARVVDQPLLRVQNRVVAVDTTQYDMRNAVPALPRDRLPDVGPGWTGVAASQSLSTFAAVSLDRTELWRWSDGTEVTNPGIGNHLTDPTYDPHGLLWVAGTARGREQSRLWWADAEDVKAVARPLDVPWLAEDERIETFRISPEGTRALLVVGTVTDGVTAEPPAEEGDPVAGPEEGQEEPVPAQATSGQRLLVAGIVRDSNGRPTDLSQPVAVAPTLTSIRAARWATPTEIVTVARRAEDQHALPFRVPLGGWLTQLSAQAGLADFIPVPTGESFTPVLRTDDGRFHTSEGTSWYTARNGDELVVPGA